MVNTWWIYVSEIRVVEDADGRLKLVIGNRRMKLEKVDERLYRAFLSAKSLMKRSFLDLPVIEKDGEEIIIEFMPFTRMKEEYIYETKGLSILDEASLWRDRERGHVYAEVLIPTWEYAYHAWMPLDLYAWIITRIAKSLGFESEVNREEQTMLIEIEKSYPLDTPLRIPILELKELDSELKKNIAKLEEKISKSTLRIISKHMNTDIGELRELLQRPEEKLSTKP